MAQPTSSGPWEDRARMPGFRVWACEFYEPDPMSPKPEGLIKLWDFWLSGFNQRPQSSSFLGLPYRILYMNTKKELLWGLRF